MNKAKIILSAIAIMAVVAGIFAFKSYRTGILALTQTNETVIDGIVYTKAGAPVCIHNGLFITPAGPNPIIATRSTNGLVTGTAAFVNSGIPATTTLTTYVCGPIVNTRTTQAN